MEFWGVEVKSGNSVSVQPGDGNVLHLSQACLGEVNNKGHESVCLYLNIDGQKHVLGTLYTEKMPQQQFDLVFEKDFELSHNWKNGSVYFIGYKARNPFDSSSSDEYGSESEDDIQIIAPNNVKPESKVEQEKPAAAEKVNVMKSDSAMAKQKVKIVEPNKDEKPDEDENSSDESEESDDESESVEAGDTDSDEESEDDGSDEETPKKVPKKVEVSKKRPAESASKTPGPEKKAKLVTPQKTDGKKGGVHVATPHPSKQAGKTPANQSSKQQTPKSAGSHSCKSCSKSFNSDQALQSHTKAKHSAGK